MNFKNPFGWAAVSVAALLVAMPLQAQDCGGSFDDFVRQLATRGGQAGHARGTVEAFLDGVRQDQKVLARDRKQSFLQKDFLAFSRALISADRLRKGAQMAQAHNALLTRIEEEYGVPRGVLLAFWALETDYGQVQGDFITRDALVTLAHDCRRPELFLPQVFAALELYARGDMPVDTTGAWAGEIGMVQMLPEDILRYGTDADGDGHVQLKISVPDALTSGAKLLLGMGWQPGQPWLEEVRVPQALDWSETGLGKPRSVAEWEAMGVRAADGHLDGAGLEADLILPMGRNGPAFLGYPNFHVFTEWNQSFTYLTTAAYLATRLSGAPRYTPGDPDPALSSDQMKALQAKLDALGHNVGEIDGILGAGTRSAVQKEQKRLGLPADAWPTRELLNRL